MPLTTTLATPEPGRRGFLMGTALGATAVLASLACSVQAAGSPTRRMPVIFIGHGSPMNAIADNGFTRRLAAWGRELPGRRRSSASRRTG